MENGLNANDKYSFS